MSDADPTSRLRERGGRARRLREAQRPNEIVAGIVRNIPTYELLGEEGLARIEAAADVILKEIGIEFRGDEMALKLWRNAGAAVEGERVRFPPGLLRSILKTAPAAFVQRARNPARSLKIGGDGGAPRAGQGREPGARRGCGPRDPADPPHGGSG